jgi:hypothetical protein
MISERDEMNRKYSINRRSYRHQLGRKQKQFLLLQDHEKFVGHSNPVTLLVQNHLSQQIIPSIQKSAYTKVAGIERNFGAVLTEGGFSPGLHVRSEWP